MFLEINIPRKIQTTLEELDFIVFVMMDQKEENRYKDGEWKK